MIFYSKFTVLFLSAAQKSWKNDWKLAPNRFSVWKNVLEWSIEFLIVFPVDRINALNSGSVLNTGNGLFYTMMSSFAALGCITHWQMLCQDQSFQFLLPLLIGVIKPLIQSGRILSVDQEDDINKIIITTVKS